ncbi:SRPBCC domain-containing protein [bacterium]|nr:SRPBCC domain-containing protein [bacterium]
MEFGARGSYNRLGELLDHLSQPGVTIQVQKDFAASAEAVFQAWLDPVQLTKWMFGPAVRDEELVRLQTDPRPGGRFSYVVRRQGQEIDHVGSYLELAPPHKLAFTWGIAGQSLDESRVDIDIEALDAGCRLTLTHRIPAQWADYAERTQQGWFKMLEKLSETLSSQTETIACP